MCQTFLAILNKKGLLKNGVKHAKEDLKLFNFFLINLRPKYRSQIVDSVEFQNVIQQVLDIGVGNFYDMTKEEKENANALAIRLMSYSLKVIMKTMPVEFLRPLKNTAMPLNTLLKSIYNYSKNNNLKELPQFPEMDFPITESD